MILSDFSSNDFIVCQIGDLIISSVYSNPNCDIMHNWNVVDNLEISDHRIITFDINFSVPTTPDITTTIKWNTNNVNWDQWSTIINDKFVNNNITCEHIRDINNKFDLDFLVSFVTTTIQQACDTTMRRYNRRRIKRHPWHNDGHLRELLHLQKSLYRRIRRSRDINQRTALIEQHQQSRHQYRQRLQQLKDDHLRQQFRGDNSVNNYYNMCHFLKHHDTLPARTLANSADPPSTVKLLLDYLFPDDNIDDDTQQQKYIRRQVNNWSNIHRNDETPFHPVTDRELINAITKFNNNTSPGFDGLAPIICKQFVANFIDIAVAIYNQCLKLKHVPYLWKISTNRGTVQGSVLGPLLWNIIIDQFLRINFGQDVHVQAFADDVTMIVSCNSRAYFNVIVNDIMQMAYCWGQNVKLTFSETKTKLMYMSRRIRSPTYPPVSMNNMAVTPVEDIKILGVTFDRKLDYRPHVHKTLEKAARVFKKIMTIAQKTYGLGPKTAHLLLNCVFLPTITYGCHVWKRAIQYQYMKLELRRTLKPMVQLITKSYSTASFIAITAISNSPPLDLVIEYVANVTIARITGKYRHNDNEIVLDKYCANINELLPPPNIINRQPFPTTNRQIFIKSIKRTLGIGCVFMAFFGDQLITTVTHRLPNHCSILQADLFTFISQFVGSLTTTWIIQPPLSYATTLGHFSTLSTNDNIIICWKKVDRNDPIQRKLRKKATVTANNHRRNVSYQSAPLSFVKRQEKINMYNNWSTVYDNDPAGTTIKTLCPHLNDARRFAPYVSFWLSQSLTGHGQFGQFLYRFGFSDDQTCQCGHDIQSVHHLRFDCPLTGRLRYHYSLAISSCVNIIDRTKMEFVYMVLKQSHLQSPYHHPFIPPFPFPIIIGYTILLLDRSHHLAIHIIGLAPSSLFWPLGPIIPGFDHQRRHPPSLSAADPSTTICRIRTWSPSTETTSKELIDFQKTRWQHIRL
ncbi:hypothetical protein DERF_010990 [Dermatophagoides farinae]|uniref:Reverse transcriptase domain-containing protein n=1 Tax=Dermatophagoides farinae TaxID=6954 RepID=A0A922HVB6_DERFA|nr:hypothetical protein DERF_010990 [Dermatophagoides farinae]